MVQIKITSNTVRKTIMTDENNTVRDVLEANEINYTNAPIYIDGAPLNVGDHDKSFAELGIAEKCNLTAVVKTDNA